MGEKSSIIEVFRDENYFQGGVIMRINTNVMALNAQNKLSVNQSKVEKSIQKLSSGLRINGAADDAAGLAISEKMRSQIRGLDQAASNAQDGISLLQTAEGALQQTTDILQRMRELVIKAQNTGVLTEDDKTSISNELSTLRDEVDRISTSTTFNGKKLLDGTMAARASAKTGLASAVRIDASNSFKGSYTISYDNTKNTLKAVVGSKDYYADQDFNGKSITGKVTFSEIKLDIDFADNKIKSTETAKLAGTITVDGEENKADFKIGANTDSVDLLSFGIGDMSSKGLSRAGDDKFSVDISTRETSDAALKAIDFAIETVSSQRSTIGTMQNRMEYAISNLTTTSENLSAAESRIRDVDMAEEMVSYTKNSILNQSAMAMLAQANQQPQSILSLLS